MTKESVLDVLMYLFENYLDDDQEPQPERQELASRLAEADFPTAEIEGALDWLDRLVTERPLTSCGRRVESLRAFTPDEQLRISVEARGFMLFLEQNGLLTLGTRELVIDRVMELDAAEIDVEQLKWVVLMVLFNQPDDAIEYARLEDFVMTETHPGERDALH